MLVLSAVVMWSSSPARSAFLLYYFDVHQSLQQEFPDLPQSEINKRISESWRMLNVVDKGYYLAKAKLEKEGIDPVSLLPHRKAINAWSSPL